MKEMRRVAAFGLIIIALCVGYLYMNQRNMMYFPDTVPPDPEAYNVSSEHVISVTTHDGLALTGWYFPASGGKKTVIHFHGNVGDYADRLSKVRDVIESGYGVVLAGYRGYGGNPGAPSEDGFYNDAHAYIDFLTKTQGVPFGDIVLYGESLGSGVAVQMAIEFPDIAGLVLEAPYTSTVDVARRTYFFLPLNVMMHDQYRNLEKAAQIAMPVLIMHGERDDVIPLEMGETLHRKIVDEHGDGQGRFIVFPDAGHNNLYDHGAALHVLEFLRSIER